MTCILILLLILCFFLSFIIYYVARKATYLSKKEKEFIDFTLEMYINYGSEINIIPKEHHEVMLKELEKLREKYFKKEE